MVESGVFDSDDKVELLDGLLFVKEPQSALHSAMVVAVHQALQRAFGRRYHVRIGAPVALDEMSEPEPDLAVVPGGPRDYTRELPAKPVLMVEVSLTSRAKDRLWKSGLYARAGLADYWVVNLVDEVLEVYRQPKRARSHRYGWRYDSVQVLKRGATVSPLAAPRGRIRVADLLP
jgi:Uma2 family endonuclease